MLSRHKNARVLTKLINQKIQPRARRSSSYREPIRVAVPHQDVVRDRKLLRKAFALRRSMLDISSSAANPDVLLQAISAA
jgi:hypothetical protein